MVAKNCHWENVLKETKSQFVCLPIADSISIIALLTRDLNKATQANPKTT